MLKLSRNQQWSLAFSEVVHSIKMPVGVVESLLYYAELAPEATLEYATFLRMRTRWSELHVQLVDLVKRFEREMSPKKCLDKSPLCYCDQTTRLWLGEILDRRWKARIQSDQITAALLAAIDKADEAMLEICSIVKSNPVLGSAPLCGQHSINFNRAAESLHIAIDAIPLDVLLCDECA